MHYSLTRATIWNLVGYIYLIIASLIATPILVHSLGISLFAQYGINIATLGLVSAINLGLPQAVTRALSRDHVFSVQRQTLWATSSLLFILTGIVSGIVAVLLISWLHVAPTLFWLIFAIAVMNNLLGHYATLPQAEGHFGYFNSKTFIVGTANTLLAAYIAWRGQGLVQILSGQLLCYFIALLPLVYFSLKYFPKPREGKVSGSVAKSLISFGLKNQIGTIVGQLQSQYSKYLLATISPLSLSSYVIAQGLVQKLAGGVSQVATALYPASARASNHTSLRAIYIRLQVGLFGLGLSGIGIYHFVGLPFLSWWLHSPQLVAIVDSVLKVFVWYFAILILSPLASTILDGSGHPEITSGVAVITTIIEISLAVVLFPRYGLFAPVYGALFALIIMTPVLLYQTEKIFRQTNST